MKCYVHPDIDAVGTCTICGKSVCSSCAVDYQGKVTCKLCVEKMTSSSGAATANMANTVVAPAAGRKEPILSLILSLFIPGLGQIYNGQVKKGFILIVGYVALWVIAAATFIIFGGIGSFFTVGLSFCCCLPVLLVPLIVVLYAMYDAYITADKINKGELVKDWLD